VVEEGCGPIHLGLTYINNKKYLKISSYENTAQLGDLTRVGAESFLFSYKVELGSNLPLLPSRDTFS
jgi:hypothetical protein